jgi:probable HAF family extracellular repeat protein
MRRFSILLLILFFCCVAAAPVRVAAQQNTPTLPHYNLIDLGTLGGDYSLAGGLSNSGWVEGYSLLSDNVTTHAVLWHKAKIMDLGTLGGPNSDAAWRPNFRGNAAGGSETGAVDPYAENYCGYGDNLICVPFFWRNSTRKMTQLPMLSGNNAWAAGINDFDWVVGNAENTTPEPTCVGVPNVTQVFQYEPVLWIKGHIKQLPTYTGDPVGQAYAINDWGQAVGYSGNCIDAFHALLWQNGVATDLGNLGGIYNEAIDINNWGQVTGISYLSDNTTYHAFLWTWGVMADLGTVPGDVSSSGDGVNDWGQVVGGSYDADGNSRAYLWQNGVMTDLNTLIPANSPLYLLEATGTINDLGWIAGIALQISTGAIHAFLLTPVYGHAADAATTPRVRIALPESVRRSLEQRRHFSHIKGGLIHSR